MDINYVVIPEKRMVKAISISRGKYAEGIPNDVGDLLVNRGVPIEKLQMGTIIGVSKTHPDDTFDETIGKQIARDRLLIKYNSKLKNIHKIVYESLNQIAKRSEWRVSSSENKIENAKKRLDI